VPETRREARIESRRFWWRLHTSQGDRNRHVAQSTHDNAATRAVLRDSDNDAAECSLRPMTLSKWRRRFAEERLKGLVDGERPGRPKADLVLSDTERAQLTRWSRRAKSAQALALRARIVLAPPKRSSRLPPQISHAFPARGTSGFGDSQST
jgi:transposase